MTNRHDDGAYSEGTAPVRPVDTTDTPQATAPRTLAAIRADWQTRIDDARTLEAQFGEPGSQIWSTVYDVHREELARVLGEIPVYLCQPADLDAEAHATRASTIAILAGWLRDTHGYAQAEIIGVPAELFGALGIALLRRLRDEARKDADCVRVQRMLTYEGPREKVEEQLARSLQGRKDHGNGVVITAVTLDIVPERIAASSDADPA